ncbi:AP-1 complex subunit sigma-2 [Amborella trichopoda]|uniref:AP-1 complex subunit sigma-2 n=1 Tax=Amborella trichopoda TaxID=13333 RepID=UPI0009BF0A34|nr:AP-1 complex subunit sigma-2 [Amborella trichopoda]|eukprot:XP_020521876.1 AP-1 complex subunit sigma-2 [Amborella trichopoda]
MIHFVLLISRQGKVRLTKWYSPYSQKERTKVIRELSGVILMRGPKLCNFVEWRGFKVIYKRYASLYFCMCIDADDNELEILEIIHHFVEILDRYFGSVCELDLIFNFHKVNLGNSFLRKCIVEDDYPGTEGTIVEFFRDAFKTEPRLKFNLDQVNI